MVIRYTMVISKGIIFSIHDVYPVIVRIYFYRDNGAKKWPNFGEILSEHIS